MTPSALIQLAMQHHQAGRLQQAEALYRNALAADPRDPGVLHLLGLLQYQLKNYEAAAGLVKQAIALNKREPLFHFNLGKILKDGGKPDEAVASYRKAVQLNPGYAEAYANLGNILQEQGKPDEAVASLRKALQLHPGDALALNSLGLSLKSQDKQEEAERCFQEALRLQPRYFEPLLNLALLCAAREQPEQAAQYFEQALSVQPGHKEASLQLGLLYCRLAQFKKAEAHLLNVVNQEPQCAVAHRVLAHIYLDHRRFERVIPHLDKIMESGQACGEDYTLKASALCEMGLASEGLAVCEEGMKYFPEDPALIGVTANAMAKLGKIKEACALYDRDTKGENPHSHRSLSNILFLSHYLADAEPQYIYERSCEWDSRYAAPLPRPPHGNDPAPMRRLKIGYISPDFRNHPVSCFLKSLMAGHSRDQVEVFCYSNTAGEDDTTAHFKNVCSNWREIISRSDDEVAAMIRQDQIDILVDLAGHSNGNRLLVFARKPAPIQVTWLGYCDTTGLSTMDYLIADDIAIPANTRQQFTEQVYRLPGSYLCYAPRKSAPPLTEPPALKNGYVTFASFNNLTKVTPHIVALWCAILQRLPDAKIVLKYVSLRDESTRLRYQQMFTEHGIPPQRAELRGASLAYLDHLASYNEVDIALDTFPYNGVTTTCDAAWMGVPVVTLAGDTFISRNSASILTHLDLPELIASTPEQYLDIAVNLANNPARLAELRSSLRARFADSPLGNPDLFARNLEAAYRAMWQKWCAQRT